MNTCRRTFLGIGTAMLFAVASPLPQASFAQSVEPNLKIGMSFPLSGVSAVLGINIMSGIEASFEHYNASVTRGPRIERIILDDGYDPSRVVSNVRKLVESDNVLAVFAIGGTAHNLAAADYLNGKGVPHLYLNTSDPRFGDMQKYPWSVPFLPSFETEMGAYVQYISKQKPDAKIAALYQNDSYGQAGLEALERALAGSTATLVGKESYLPSDPSVDVQMSKLARTKADVFINISIPKFAAQAVRRAASLQWKPLQILQLGSASGELVLKPAGVEESQGIMSGAYLKDPADPALANDPAVMEYLQAMKKYQPSVNALDPFVVRGWAMAETLIVTLKGARQMSREALIKSARNLDAQVGMMLVPVKTGPDRAFPIDSLYMEIFKGNRFVVDGPLITPKS